MNGLVPRWLLASGLLGNPDERMVIIIDHSYLVNYHFEMGHFAPSNLALPFSLHPHLRQRTCS